MSTTTPESRDLLRLYKCVVDTGTEVLTAFAGNKLLATYNGNCKQFFDDKKHELFHLWESKKLSCCECPPAGCNLKRTGHMDNWIFKKLYGDNGPESISHILRNGRDVVQVCLHKYVTQNIPIHELDISAISFLLRNLIILSANETTSLDIITNTRNKIFHAYSSNYYRMTLLNTMWNELENALVDLADPSYKRMTRTQIKYVRKVDLEKEEITKLLSTVEEVLQEVKASFNNNNMRLIGMETRLENNAINYKDDIKQHTTDEISYYTAQAQQALSKKVQNTEEKLLLEVQSTSDDNVRHLDGMENRLANKSINYRDDIKQHTTDEVHFYAAQAQQALSEKVQNAEENLLLEVQSTSEDHVRHLDGMENRLANKSINYRDNIKQHTTEEVRCYAAQAQQALSENIQNSEENLQKEMKEVKTYCQTIETDVNNVSKKQDKTHDIVMEMSKTLKNLQLSVRCERPADLFVPEGACADTMECSAIWHIEAPEDWDIKAIEATMKDQPNKDESFKVKVVRKGSLIMLTTVAASILSDSEAFKNAIFSFLTKMIKDCNINTEIPGRVDVTLHILNANEVSFSCVIPPEVRHKQGTENLTCKLPNTTTDDKAVQTEVPNTTTDDKADQTKVPKKQGSALVRHDIAFLNADNENEIKWVQRAAFLMKDKLGIECAIPGKDYLCGVPEKKLDVYFQRFKTVIVTVTKDSQIASKYKINQFESSIVVELDYRKSIPVVLRNMQYINGSLCEHLWFSQMAKVILKRHPDIERRISKQQIYEVPVLDCESCISSASTAVYHKLKLWLNQQTQPIEALFCGSLITEPFIIEVCNELVKVKDFASRIRWEKSTASTYREQQLFVVFVFVSKYLKKCKPLEEFITKHRRTAVWNLYSIKIEETESPLFIKIFTTDIRTLSMDPAEITASIQTILKYNDPTGQLYTPYQPRQPTVQVDQYSSPIKEKKKKMKGKGPMQPGQFYYHDYLSTVESVGYKDTIMTHMQKKKSLEFHPKEKERKERHTKPLGEYHQHSEEKELTSTYEDSFSKEYPDKTESTGFTEGLYKHWSKELYPKEKERKEPHTKQLGENQYPDKKERIGKSKIPWLKGCIHVMSK